MRSLKGYLQFLKFCFFGVLNTVINLIVFLIILSFGMNYQIAGIMGFFSGAFFGFFVNRKFTFSHNISTTRGLFLYLLAQFFSLSIHVIVQSAAVEVFYVDQRLSQLIGLIPSAIINFVLLKYIVFKKPINFLD